MKKSKKVFYIMTTIVEILLLIGAYMVNYFTHKKMGMARHVIHKNYVWESTYPIKNMQYGSIIALTILMLLVLTLYMKRKQMLNKMVTVMCITMVICALCFTGFILVYSSEEIRAFYYISFMIGVITLIQIFKTFIGVIWYKNEK